MEKAPNNNHNKTTTHIKPGAGKSQSPAGKYILPILLLLLGILVVSPPALLALDHGYKFIRNYSQLEYDHQPQNWGGAQAENGILYFANQGGVLEYDGATWRVHYLEEHPMRSLAIDDRGTVFVGGYDSELWYLAPGVEGTWEFVSLTEHLDEKHRDFGGVWATHAVKNKIYFRTTDYLFIWDHKKMITLKATDNFNASFVHNGELIIQDKGKGLMKPVHNTLQPLPSGEFFAGPTIKVFTSFSEKEEDSTLFVGNRDGDFFLYDGIKITPFPTEAKDYLKKYNLNHGTRLCSGEFALATNKGLVIISPEGKLNTIIDNTYGLQSDEIKFVFRDKFENIWLCTDNGITKIEYHSPISFIGSSPNLPGIVMTVVKHNEVLYVGTRSGLYRANRDLKFKQVPDAIFSCNSLITNGGKLLAATSIGVFQVNKDTLVKVIEDGSLSLLNSTHFPGVTWCGTRGEVLIALENSSGQWREKFRSESLGYEIHSIAEAPDGTLWLGTTRESVLRVRFPNEQLLQHEITLFDSAHGLLGSGSYVTCAAGNILVATTNGLFKYESETNTFTPSPILGEDFAGGETAKPVFRITQGWDRQIWFSSESRNYVAIPDPGQTGGFKLFDKPLLRMPPLQTNSIYPDPAQKTTWFARHDGLYGYDTTVNKNYDQEFASLIRKIILNENSDYPVLLYNGDRGKTRNSASAPIPQITFKNRNLYIKYAAPFYEAENNILYQCFLEGYDNGWTSWSKETKRHYTNLDPGTYRFRVRAKNIYDTQSREDEFRFRVLSPWYRTWWMYLVYGIFFIFSIYQVIQWRSRKLLREKEHLEATVQARTREIFEKNQQLERQTLQLHNQSEKLKEMDRVKSRFFANISHEFRTPLTLILGPLDQMYLDSKEQKEKKKIHTMLENSRRLLNLINQLLDLSRLDSGKEKLQTVNQDIVSFLRGIIANFENAAEQKKLNLVFNALQENIFFYFDSQKMEKVIINLLMNAVKYTPPGGHITISVSTEKPEPEGDAGETVKISVEDTGAGIPHDQIDYIFDRFFQAERFKTKNQGGTGIGLALVKEYVELHHGKIDVHSLEGKGTEFVLHFPVGSEHLEPGQITRATEADTSMVPLYGFLESAYDLSEEGEMENGGDFAAHEAVAAGDKDDSSQKTVILVVEDNSDMRRYICEPLELDPEFSVVEAADGLEGIEKAKTVIPDLIISDIMMPGMDGYELCRTLKTDIKTSHIPIVLLTAKASQESVIQGYDTGADDYITKPFNTQILLARIKNLVELRHHFQLKIQKQMLLQPDQIIVSSMDREFIKELKTAIQKHMSDPEFGVERLSELIIMNRSTLFRKIKALTGETPQLFIRSFRLQRGAELLKKQFGTISQVASEVGFSNVAYFAQCFREKYNINPSSFMATHHEDEFLP